MCSLEAKIRGNTEVIVEANAEAKYGAEARAKAVAAARCLALPHSLLYEGLVLPCPGAGTSVSRGWYFLPASF